MAAKKNEQQVVICPVGKFFMDLENVFGKKSDFFKHMTQSRIEFLKAMRAVLDERIDTLEKEKAPKKKKRMTKIKVT
jgi:hypothetical protein